MPRLGKEEAPTRPQRLASLRPLGAADLPHGSDAAGAGSCPVMTTIKRAGKRTRLPILPAFRVRLSGIHYVADGYPAFEDDHARDPAVNPSASRRAPATGRSSSVQREADAAAVAASRQCRRLFGSAFESLR